jgi:PD-(D/E)XK nuclease superfamily
MKITLGQALDGIESQVASDSLGDIVCGPLRLMDVLETQLGLKRKSISDMTRIFQLVKVLEKLIENNQPFYSASFEKDPLAVSEALLQWRDSLALAGWDGTTDGSSRRLRALADVNTALKEKVASGVPDRLMAIHDALAHRHHCIETIIVVDPPSAFPLLWRQIFIKLRAQFRTSEEYLCATNNEQETDLIELKAALFSGSTEKIKLRNDGSVMQFSAYSEFTLAHVAAKLLRDISKESHVLIAESDCTVLDDVLIAGDQSSLGVHPTSLARPIPQLLLLALRLCWKPLNPLHLLEFLTHPNCPVEFHLRSELSRVMVECPGVGGPKWVEAIEAVKKIYQTKPADEAKELFPRLEKDLADWIHVSKYAPRVGVPGAEIAGHCSGIAKWAKVRLIKEKEQGDSAKVSLFQSLATQASELGEAVKETEIVTQCRLERLVRKVSGNGWPSAKNRELGHGHRIGSPAACIETADTVIWWNFSDPEHVALPHWTDAEVEDLQKHGAEIPTAASILSAESGHWLQPFLSARKKLVLFTPRQRNGEPVAAHPLLSRLQAMVDGKFPTTHLDADLQRKKVPSAEQIRHVALRTPRRWWKLKDGTQFVSRTAESFSSAEKFVYSPYSWILDYKAVLRPGVLSQFRMRSENVLRGNLLHRLLDLLVAGPVAKGHWAAVTEGDLKDYIEKQWPVILEQEGATLLLLGKQSEATALLDTAKRALWSLSQHLRAAQIKETDTNVNFEAEFIGGKLEGYVDLLIKNEKSKVAVVDLKSGRLEEKQRELQSNVQLQLAIYGFLHKQVSGEWPSAMYFILNSGRMLAQNKDYFPLAYSVPAKSGSGGLETCWNEFIEMWRYRRTLLDQGWIELTLSITEPQNGDTYPAAVPFEHWQPGKSQDRYNDFKALTGVEENA